MYNNALKCAGVDITLSHVQTGMFRNTARMYKCYNNRGTSMAAFV